MNGGSLLVDTLIAHGIDTAFTVPGESFLAVLEALRQKRNSIRLVTVRHEGGGGFAAEAFGKLSGRPAAVFVSRGPGATNAAIAVHTAQQDCTPMLLFVGDVRTHSKGREAFQEIDQAAMFAPVAKAVLTPADANAIGDTTARAIDIATTGRPGPVVIVLPRDLTEAAVTAPPPAATAKSAPDAVDLAPLAAAINAAERPVFIAGELVALAGAGDPMAAVARAAGAPVMAAYRRQDVLDNAHPSYAGHLEINRVSFQQRAFADCDLIVSVGSRLDGITAMDGALIDGKQVAMIYPDATVLSRFDAAIRVDAPVDAALAALAPMLDAPAERAAWTDTLHQAFLAFSSPGSVPVHGAVDLAEVVAEVQRQCPRDAAILTDGGSFARWVHRYFRFRAAHTQAGPMSGAMGYAVPGAIGAGLAKPGQPVVAFVGDGGFLMTGQELATAVEQRLPMVVIVCDNGAHGSILQGQWRAYGDGHAYGTQLHSPDFAALGRGYGAKSWTVRETAAFSAAFAEALAAGEPTLIHVLTDQRDIAPYGAGKDAV